MSQYHRVTSDVLRPLATGPVYLNQTRQIPISNRSIRRHQKKSEEIIDAFVGVLLYQVSHTLLKVRIGFLSKGEREGKADTYLRHDWLSIGALDVAEGHLCALMLVELQPGEVYVRNLIKGYWSQARG